MTAHDDHSHTIVSTAITLSFRCGGPLDGAGGMLWVPPDQHLTDLRVSLPTGDGHRDTYHYDGR